MSNLKESNAILCTFGSQRKRVYYYYYYYYYYTNCTLIHCLNKKLLKNVSETGSTSIFRLK